MCSHRLLFTSVLFLVVSSAFAIAPEGIPRELARERAGQISAVRYQLSFVLVPQAPATSGTEQIQFRLRSVSPVLLDFRDGTVQEIVLNGSPIPAHLENGHIELPASALRLGDNTVRIRFTAQVAAAGKAITRYQDRDDHAEYLYTLFVPMDASMAFPCFDQPNLKARFTLELTAPENWTVVSNTAGERASMSMPGHRRTLFAETEPIS